MRLLLTTQVVDSGDPGLGFMHRWIEVFAGKFESIDVICLYEGTHSLPENVCVHSLGKEKGGSRFLYALRYLSLLMKLRGSYDGVLVHMNPEYVILGAWAWSGKPAMLWYNHAYGGPRLALASHFVSRILHTSPYAAPAGKKKAHQMPAGIDTDIFRNVGASKAGSVYFQGRLHRSKRIGILLSAFALLKERMPAATLDLAGPEDAQYMKELQLAYAPLFQGGGVTVIGPVVMKDAPGEFSRHAASVNLTASGNFDKSVLESLACSTPAVVSGEGFRSIVPDECFFVEGDAASLAETLERILTLPEAERAQLAEKGAMVVREQHSLVKLADSLYDIFTV